MYHILISAPLQDTWPRDVTRDTSNIYARPHVTRLALARLVPDTKQSRLSRKHFPSINKILFKESQHPAHITLFSILDVFGLKDMLSLHLSCRLFRGLLGRHYRTVNDPSWSFTVPEEGYYAIGHRCLIVKVLLRPSNKEKPLVGAFSGHCKTSRRFVDSFLVATLQSTNPQLLTLVQYS